MILPYWEGRHPDHYRASEIGYEACFLAGLKKIDQYTEPHRPHKIIYSSIYANVTPSFVVDISRYFEKRMESLFAYRSQYGPADPKRGRRRCSLTKRKFASVSPPSRASTAI